MYIPRQKRFILSKISSEHCPYRIKKVKKDHPAWITSNIEQTYMRDREKSFKNNHKSWRVPRPLVQRRTRCSKRAYMYLRKQLNSNQVSKKWWNTLKSTTRPNKNSSNVYMPTIDG
jgi:hypothetical protein